MAGLNFDLTVGKGNTEKVVSDFKGEISGIIEYAKAVTPELDKMMALSPAGLVSFAKEMKSLTQEELGSLMILTEGAKATKKSMEEMTDPLRIGVYNKKLQETEAMIAKLVTKGSTAPGVEDMVGINLENLEIQQAAVRDIGLEVKRLKAIFDAAPKDVNFIPKQELAAAKVELAENEAILNKMKVALGGTGNASVTLQTKLRGLVQAMGEMELAGKQNTDEYRKLRDEASKLSDAQNSVRKGIRGQSEDMRAVSASVNLMSGAFSAGVGVMSMFTDNTENMAQVQTELQSVIAVSIGIQQITEDLSKRSIIMVRLEALQLRAKAAAQAASTKGTITGTIAQRAFNLVANANPYVLLATVLISLAGAVYLFSKKTSDAAKVQREFNKAVAEQLDQAGKELVELEKLYRSATNDSMSREERLKATNKMIAAYPGLFSNIDKEIIMNGRAEASYLAVKAAILEAAKARGAQSLLEKRTAEELKEQEKVVDKIAESKKKEAKLYKDIASGKMSASISSGSGMSGASTSIKQDNIQLVKNQVSVTKELQKELENRNKTFEEQNSFLIGIATTGTQKLEDAQKPPKNSEAWHKDKISELESEKALLDMNTARYKEIQVEIEKYQKAIAKPPKEKKVKAPKEKAEEIFPAESVAEVQQRIMKLNKKISIAVDIDAIEKLKSQIVAAEKDLAAAQAKIQIKTLQDTFKESQSLWVDYYNAVDKIGEEKAGVIYSDLLKDSATQFEALKKMQSDLNSQAVLSPEDSKILVDINTQIDTLLGKKTGLVAFKESIGKSIDSMESVTDRVQLLKNYLKELDNPEGISTGKFVFIKEELEKEQQLLTDSFNDFLKSQTSYEAKRLEVIAKYAELRKQAIIKNASEEVQASINDGEKIDLAAISFEEFKGSDAWVKAFDDLNDLTTAELEKLIVQFELFGKDAAKSMAPADFKAYQAALEKLRLMVLNKNPFKAMTSSVAEYIKKVKEGTNTTKDLKDMAAAIGASGSMLSAGIGETVGILESVGVKVSDETKGIIDDVETIIGGVSDIAVGLASGNPIQIMKGIAGVIKGVASLVSGDNKKEAQIQKWAGEVKRLQSAYAALGEEINRALGTDVYSKQQEEIANLKIQRELLAKMADKERDKKKADQGKIDDYNAKIKEIGQAINSVTDSITSNILQTSAGAMADQLTDALVSAFEKGEDAAASMDKVVNNMFKNMVKNALAMRMEKPINDMLNSLLSSIGIDPTTGEGVADFTKLTPEVINKFKDGTNQLTNSMQGVWDALSGLDIFDQDIKDAADEGGMKGDFQRITSDQASKLVSQFNGLRMDTKVQINLLQGSLVEVRGIGLSLVKIESNTSNLIQIRKDISDMNSKISSDPGRSSGVNIP